MFALRRSLTGLLVFVCLASPLFAAFQSTETYLVAVGRAPGAFGAQIYSTVWATNLSGAPNSFTVYLLKQGQANTSPASFTDTLAPGETKIYENIVQSKFGLTSTIGAARIVSAGEILVSERIYNQPSGADLGNTEGFFFAGVPKTFSISSGQSASIQGVNQGGTENFRYNFILVETGGASTTVNVQVFDADGTLLGQKVYPLQAYEQLQGNVGDIVPTISTINGRITATVTGGSGSALIAGAQAANESQDASGFEMSFRDDLLGGTTSGGGLTAVIHDSTLTGSGTPSAPLGVNPGAVVTSLNGFHGAVTLSPGSNVTITPSGSTLTIASSGGGGGGGLTLPFMGTTSSSSPSFSITNTGTGIGIQGTTAGTGGTVAGVSGTCPTSVLCAGVQGTGQTGLAAHGTATGVYAETTAANSVGLYAINDASSGYIARFQNGFGTDRVTIGTNGNVGIGVSSPAYKLHMGAGDQELRVEGPSVNGTLASFGGHGDFGIDAVNVAGGRFIVKDNGRVGIGTNNPNATLDVEGYLFLGALSTGNLTHLCVGGATNGVVSSCSSAAEYVPTIDSGLGFPETGDVVSIARAIKNPYSDPHGPFIVQRSATACDDNLLGFIVNPGSGADGVKKNDHYLPLAIYGYFPAKVTTENGSIHRGDPLTSSSKVGYAMRTTGACRIIGYALEDADRDGKVQVFAHLSENVAPEFATLKALSKEQERRIAAQQRELALLQEQVGELREQLVGMQRHDAVSEERVASGPSGGHDARSSRRPYQ